MMDEKKISAKLQKLGCQVKINATGQPSLSFPASMPQISRIFAQDFAAANRAALIKEAQDRPAPQPEQVPQDQAPAATPQLPSGKYPSMINFRDICPDWYSHCLRGCEYYRDPETTRVADLPQDAVLFCRKFIVVNGDYVPAQRMTGTD
jgi:hypothetical protein